MPLPDLRAIEQLTVTTLRNVIGGLDLERTLTSREQINAELRGVLDEATGKWGIRVNRVELKAIDPPGSIKDAMEKQLRADREKRAAILTAEGGRQAQILTAEGAKQGAILTAECAQQAAILTAEGERQAQILLAQGQAQAIGTVFEAIREGRPDPELLAYQYLQTLPKIGSGDGNHTWLISNELTRALDAFASGFGHHRAGGVAVPGHGAPVPGQLAAKAPAPAPPGNGHTARTRGRDSKRMTGSRQEGEPDRISDAPSTSAA
jgi:regulator of protease activity HflC (stomatin/prohibitin superfamily)